jgi:hypothetical protein
MSIVTMSVTSSAGSARPMIRVLDRRAEGALESSEKIVRDVVEEQSEVRPAERGEELEPCVGKDSSRWCVHPAVRAQPVAKEAVEGAGSDVVERAEDRDTEDRITIEHERSIRPEGMAAQLVDVVGPAPQGHRVIDADRLNSDVAAKLVVLGTSIIDHPREATALV